MLKNKHNEQEVLKSKFDINIHKETFINYLEVVILEDGTIEYAVPSHQLKVINIITQSRNITHQQVSDLCPPEFYFDYNTWLCSEAKAIMVWNDFYVGEPNDVQIQTLLKLMQAGLYNGKVEVDRV